MMKHLKICGDTGATLFPVLVAIRFVVSAVSRFKRVDELFARLCELQVKPLIWEPVWIVCCAGAVKEIVQRKNSKVGAMLGPWNLGVLLFVEVSLQQRAASRRAV